MTALTVGALGVVFGDIGTSPLYALQAVFTTDNHAVHANAEDVYGVISLSSGRSRSSSRSST